MQLLEREFTVAASPERAWSVLAAIEEWPRWAKHIRSVEAEPPGPLTAATKGSLVLAGGIRSTFRVTEFEPGRRWLWDGPFLWLSIAYDHLLEPTSAGRTRIVFRVGATGFAVSTLGRVFARIYARNLDRAIPRLISEIEGGSPRR